MKLRNTFDYRGGESPWRWRRWRHKPTQNTMGSTMLCTVLKILACLQNLTAIESTDFAEFWQFWLNCDWILLGFENSDQGKLVGFHWILTKSTEFCILGCGSYVTSILAIFKYFIKTFNALACYYYTPSISKHSCYPYKEEGRGNGEQAKRQVVVTERIDGPRGGELGFLFVF
jgi:hypothetical protein